MCDEDSLSLQNILQSLPRRELKIILERAEYLFPALKDGLVSVYVCVWVWGARAPKKNCKCVFSENYVGENFFTKLIFLLICST